MFAVLPEGMELVRYRSCLFDDITRREIGNGIRQIVILGSGFDMRPLVFETEGVRFCDVDQPAVLAFKGKVLESHGVTPCVGIPCNYLEVDLPAKLEEAGLDLDAPILFIWEGNTMYLPEALIYDFLGRLSSRISLVQDRLRLLRQERHRPHHRRRAGYRHHRRVREHPEGEVVDRFRRSVRCRGTHRLEGRSSSVACWTSASRWRPIFRRIFPS